MTENPSNVSMRALHDRIHRIIDQEVADNETSYNKDKPYQAYERIGFTGNRWSVEKRIAEYELDALLGPDRTVLDIGSNLGFFVAEFALSCKAAHGIEPNRHLNRIGRLVATELGVGERTRFFDCGFEDFEPPCEYDSVFSLAAFFTADGRERSSATEYFSKINRLLKPGGTMFYESTSYTTGPDSPAYSHYLAKCSALESIGEQLSLVRQWETPSGASGYFRQFATAGHRPSDLV